MSKIIKIRATLNVWSCSHKESAIIEVEVPRKSTPEQIEKAKEKAVREWVFNNVTWSYSEPIDEDDE